MKTPKVLVLVPLKLELQLFIKALEKEGFSFIQEQKKHHKIWSTGCFVFACSGRGKVQTALAGQDVLQNFKDIETLVCLGSGGSLTNLKSGQLVVATQTIEHDHIIKVGQSDLPSFAGSPNLLKALQSEDLSEVVLTTIASGDEDILDLKRAREIHFKTGADLVAWEGAGAARLANFSGINFLEMRVVTDGCSVESLKQFKKDLETFVFSSGKALACVLKKIELQSEIGLT